MEAAAKSTLQGRTTMLTLLGLFAGIALLLACIGIYGVMSYSIGQRTREIGIRMALGASAQRVAKLVLRHGLALVLAGLVIGAVGAGFANQILGSQLYDVGRLDPFVFLAVAALLLLVGGIASWLPARRATRLDPTVALRAD
jgi:putative ABC transport system permease protein